MLKIWFNHWFSTAYHIINMMKEYGDVYIVGSSRNPDSVVGLACDEWHTEPDNISDEEYVKWCAEFCRKNRIDVFVPRRGMDAVSRSRELFDGMGTRLLLDTDPVIMDILQSKSGTYKWASGFAPECVPMHFAVSSMEEFERAYEKITSEYERACFKFDRDEGAVSFRVIDNTMGGADGLYKAPGMKLSLESARSVLSAAGFAKPVIVMPYLAGTEVSADCISGNGVTEDIIIPRYKSNGRIYTIKYDSEIIFLCRKILRSSGLSMPCNIQFKYHGDKPYLLEINTRMSGGVQLSCLGAGVNIPKIALGRVMGEYIPFEQKREECKVSYIETPVAVAPENAALLV